MAERPVRALIFDVDGTLAETEDIHRAAFNRAFADAGLPYVWDRGLYGELLQVTGGKRRIARFLSHHMGLTDSDEIETLSATLHVAKNRLYAEAVASGEIALRPGVAELMREARKSGLELAIATTTSRSNLVGLMTAVDLPADWFAAIVCGEDVTALKPDPAAYLLALHALGLEAADCLAFEDSDNGLLAARAAGLGTIVTPSAYTIGQDFSGALMVLRDLDAFDLNLFR